MAIEMGSLKRVTGIIMLDLSVQGNNSVLNPEVRKLYKRFKMGRGKRSPHVIEKIRTWRLIGEIIATLWSLTQQRGSILALP